MSVQIATAEESHITAPAESTVSVSLEERHAGLARLACFAILALMILPAFTGQIYIADDLINYHFPIRQFYAQCLANGDAFDWMPSLFSGFYLTGSGQAGTYHPWHWLIYRCLPVDVAFNLEVLGSYPFMLAGMVLFLKHHLHRRDAAWLGGMIFTFSGFCLVHFLHPNAIAVVAHLPWLLLCQSLIIDPATPSRCRWRAELGVSLLTGSQLLLGYPQYVWYSLLAEIVFCLGFGGWSWAGWQRLFQLAAFKGIGLMLGAVQILPSVDALAHSSREHLTQDHFYIDPLSPADMLQWIGPYLTQSRVFGENTHELTVYCGALPFLLCIYAVFYRGDGTEPLRLKRTMIVLGVIALWLSLGKLGGLYVLQTYVPLIGKFRWPARIVVLMHFAVAVLAAIGYRRLAVHVERRAGHAPRSLGLLWMLSLCASAGIWLFYRDSAPVLHLLLSPYLFFLAYQTFKEYSLGKTCPGFMLFIALDLGIYGLVYCILGNTMSLDRIQSEIAAPPGPASAGRIVNEIQISDGPGLYRGNKLLITGRQQADGYEGLLPLQHTLGDNMTLDSLRIAGVKWVANVGAHSRMPGLQPAADSKDWLEVPDPLPRARLTRHVRGVDSIVEGLPRLSAAGPVLVLKPIAFHDSADNRPGQIHIEADRPGRISVSTTTTAEGLLVINERFDPGWRITLNGDPAELIQADLDYMACVVPAGTNQLEFTFAPESLQRGRWISLAGACILMLYAMLRFARPQLNI